MGDLKLVERGKGTFPVAWMRRLYSHHEYTPVTQKQRPFFSIWYHKERFYPCPDCGGQVVRADIQGWWFFCDKPCNKAFPGVHFFKVPLKEQSKNSIMDRIKEALT